MISHADLEMPRGKPRAPLAAIIYRLLRLVTRVVGPRRILPTLLDALWIGRRFAFEQAGEMLGNAFKNRAMGLREEDLADYIDGAGCVIDVGCGDGRWSRTAAKYADQVLGIDLNDRTLNAARSRTSEVNVHFRKLEGRTAAATAGRFDVALLIHVLEHVEDPVRFLVDLGGLAPLLVIEVPDVEADPLNVVRLTLGRPFYTDADHLREYTTELLDLHLSQAGWIMSQVDRRGGAIVALAHRSEGGPNGASG